MQMEKFYTSAEKILYEIKNHFLRDSSSMPYEGNCTDTVQPKSKTWRALPYRQKLCSGRFCCLLLHFLHQNRKVRETAI